MASPAETLRSAAGLIRERAEAVPQGAWKGRPWVAEECGDDEAGNCPCIVSQGERKPYLEAQVPPIQYVCDAESAGHAAHIASWHPAVALAVADWLESAARDAEMIGPDPAALAVARAFLGEAQAEGAER
jgi:hypothetical protein